MKKKKNMHKELAGTVGQVWRGFDVSHMKKQSKADGYKYARNIYNLIFRNSMEVAGYVKEGAIAARDYVTMSI